MINIKEVISLYYWIITYKYIVKSMKTSKEFQEYERKMKEEGKEFSHEMYEEMKKSQ